MHKQKQFGFTLIELLAVIVLIVIILAIAIPSISNVINSSKKTAFESDAKMVLQAVKYKKLESENFDPATINKENINSLLGLTSANYTSVSINMNDGVYNIRIIGAGKWDGLIACGTDKNIGVVNSISECSADKIKPVITLLGSSSVIVDLGSSFTDDGATAIDDTDGNITNKIVRSGTVDANTEGIYTITYTVSDLSGNTATATRTVEVLKKLHTFSYTGNYQTFTIPKSATYKVELWGASGSTVSGFPNNGKGAYTSGNIYFNKGEVIYIYVGQVGDQNRTWKFNGGGYGGLPVGSNSGGGATDIRLVSGAWDDYNSLKSRIMVAAGGGGAAGTDAYNNAGQGGFGGAFTGLSGTYYSGNGASGYGLGGTQTAGGEAGANTYDGTGTSYAGSFGIGGQSDSQSSKVGSGGGGGGYYGGGAGGGVKSNGYGNGGAGGSSFISGHTGCNAIDETGTHTGSLKHYSGKVFAETVMVAGNASMPTLDGISTMTGNKGNGYAKIIFVALGGKPSMELLGSSTITIYVDDTYSDAGATAADINGIDLTSKIVTTSNVNPSISGTYQVVYTVTDSDGNTTTVTRNVIVKERIYTFNYTGNYQTFTIPKSATYKVELWGASGSTVSGYPNNGKGAYTSGNIYFNKGEVIYIYVGQVGDQNRTWKFNGGGYGGLPVGSNSGGGATDIRLVSGAWDDYNSLKSRIMVAAGGGGAAGTDAYNNAGQGGFGGAFTGLSGTYYSGNGASGYGLGGTQTAGGEAGANTYDGTGTSYAGSFGIGGQSDSQSSKVGSGGGGGGYYGGGAGGAVAQNGYGNGGGGGSSFISGYIGSNAIDATGVHTGQPNHYSGLVFTNTVMTAGNALMPTLDGISTMTGNKGNGYAKITLIGV